MARFSCFAESNRPACARRKRRCAPVSTAASTGREIASAIRSSGQMPIAPSPRALLRSRPQTAEEKAD
eukprot:scaffold197353_cov33-Tisochrysis_lutea.AAC.1